MVQSNALKLFHQH